MGGVLRLLPSRITMRTDQYTAARLVKRTRLARYCVYDRLLAFWSFVCTSRGFSPVSAAQTLALFVSLLANLFMGPDFYQGDKKGLTAVAVALRIGWQRKRI